jgi:hypothetical protein
VFTLFSCNNYQRSLGPSSGAQSSWPSASKGVAGKISIRERQFNTGATRPRMTGMAIISSGLRIIESYGLWETLQSTMFANIIIAPVFHLPSAIWVQNAPDDSDTRV